MPCLQRWRPRSPPPLRSPPHLSQRRVPSGERQQKPAGRTLIPLPIQLVYSSGPSLATPRLQRWRTRSPQQPTLFLTRSTTADGAAAAGSSPMSACSSSSTGAPRQSTHQPRRCHDQEDPHLHRPRVRCHRCCWRPGVGADRMTLGVCELGIQFGCVRLIPFVHKGLSMHRRFAFSAEGFCERQ